MARVIREARIRRAFRRHGILLRRQRTTPGGYFLIDARHAEVVRFGWTLDDCEDWLRGQ